MEVNARTVKYFGELSAIHILADGTRRDIGVVSSKAFNFPKLFSGLVKALGLSAAIAMLVHEPLIGLPVLGLVTDVGLNAIATDFTGGAALATFKFHDSGTGSTAAAQTDTTLQTQAGPATRATGTNTQTQSASGTGSTTPAIMQSVGTIAYLSTLAITEWGLFNQAAQGGSMWDHRIFSAINVVSGDSIQFTYSLSIPGGGT